MTEAVCTVAPEWWGAGRDDLADIEMALWGCRICPVSDCLEQFAAATGKVDRPSDLGRTVVAGLYGSRLADAVNQLVGERSRKGRECGTDAAYKRHLRAGETPCDGCRAAHSERQARWATRSAA